MGKALAAYKSPAQLPATLPARPNVAQPTGVLTLPQVQALAVQHNPELAAVGWEVQAGEGRMLQAGLPPNPEFGIEVENVAGSKELQGFGSGEIIIFLSQEIEVAGKRLKRTRVAALERDLSAWDYETARLDVLTRTTQAFVDVLSAQERRFVNQKLLRLAERVLNTVVERVKAGKVSPVEETRARVALGASRIELQRSQRNLESARKRLVATWGGTTTASFEKAEGSLESITAIPSAEHMARRIAQNPDIARWVTEMAQRQAAVELEAAGRIPNPTIGGGFRYFNKTDDNALVMEFSIPLPVFDRNQGNLQAARYPLAKAADERRLAEVQVHAALGETYAALSATFMEATALKNEVLPGAQQAFATVSEGYRQGKFDFLGGFLGQPPREAQSQGLKRLTQWISPRSRIDIGDGEKKITIEQWLINERQRIGSNPSRLAMVVRHPLSGIMALYVNPLTIWEEDEDGIAEYS